MRVEHLAQLVLELLNVLSLEVVLEEVLPLAAHSQLYLLELFFLCQLN